MIGVVNLCDLHTSLAYMNLCAELIPRHLFVNTSHIKILMLMLNYKLCAGYSLLLQNVLLQNV